MRFTQPQKFILFSLGYCYATFQKRFRGKPLEVSLSKIDFIRLARQAGITAKKERTLYKSLQHLEKRKYIRYANKSLELTVRGKKQYEKIYQELKPFLHIRDIFRSKDILHYTKKVQTHLKGK